MNTPSSIPVQRHHPLRIILLAGLTAGILDGTAAVINYMITNNGKNPVIIFNFIASGLFGREAMSGGWEMAGWGLLFHLIIAILFAAFFYLIYHKIRWIGKNIVISGILYGFFVWLVMNKIVLPLSPIPALKAEPLKIVISMLILVVCVGLPIALITKKYSEPNK